MAKRIEGVSDEVLRCAREEFMEMGFQDASMRVIAAKANTSTGSIYTRYGDKSGLFHALVDDTVNGLLQGFETVQAAFDNRPVEAKHDALDYASDQVTGMVNYLYDHLDDFRLLTRCSDKDCYEKMIDSLIDIDVKYTFRFMQCTGRGALTNDQTSALMVHMLSNAFYSGLFETIRHDLSREEAIVYALRLRRFFRMGWADLLGMEEG